MGFSIHFRNAELDDAIAPSLAHLETTSSNAFKPCLEFDLGVHSSEFVFRRDDVEVFRSLLLDDIIERLIIEITNFVYNEVEWIISMHAAAIGNKSGCVLLPGVSGSGKSTLTAALVSKGHAYFSDDLVVLYALTYMPSPSRRP